MLLTQGDQLQKQRHPEGERETLVKPGVALVRVAVDVGAEDGGDEHGEERSGVDGEVEHREELLPVEGLRGRIVLTFVKQVSEMNENCFSEKRLPEWVRIGLRRTPTRMV